MKTIHHLFILTCLATGVVALAADAPTNPPAGSPPTLLAATNAPSTPAVTNAMGQTPAPPNPAPADTASTNAASTNLATFDLSSTNGIAPMPGWTNTTDGLRLNFRGVPLEMVLNYLSDAAGFVIVLDTDVRGKVDVWSNTPVTKDEAVTLLNAVLNKNGYAAIRNGRTLTIVARDAAKTKDVPVKRGNEPNDIPKDDEIVTQIIPVRFINAAQLTKDLQPLMPMTSTMTANEAGNALVITDTQTTIHRMAEIVKALDTSLSSAATIRVYPLKFADAKTVATVIKDLFQSQDSSSRNANDLRAQFFQRMRGGGGGGGPFGGLLGGGGSDQTGGSSSSGGRAPAPKVLATSDDRSNALVVSVPDEMIATVDELVKSIDINVEDVTEVRVFRLKYSDPVEMADLLSNLFPDETRNSSDQNSNRGGVRFGGGGRTQTASTSQQSERAKKMGRVVAVPDQRTASVVVSAARDLMEQIAAMIEQLDANPAKKQKVFVYNLENADVQEVEQILRNMFDKNGTMNSRNTQNQNSPLTTRGNQTQTGTSTSLGTSGSGGSRSSGSSGGGF